MTANTNNGGAESNPKDVDAQLEQLRSCNYISEAAVKNLCQEAMEILMEESNVQRVNPPVIVEYITIYPYTLTILPS